MNIITVAGRCLQDMKVISHIKIELEHLGIRKFRKSLLCRGCVEKTHARLRFASEAEFCAAKLRQRARVAAAADEQFGTLGWGIRQLERCRF